MDRKAGILMDSKTIIETYNRIETADGGLANADPVATLNKVATELKLPFERVRSVMIDHWTMWGSG
jgi:hypothetical protein